jgi:thiamine-phosphate pyrophosphorylase
MAVSSETSLPRIIYITDSKGLGDQANFLRCIKKNIDQGIRAIYLREKDLDGNSYQRLLEKCLNQGSEKSPLWIIPAHYPFLDQYPQTAVQAGKQTPSVATLKKNLDPNRIIGFSAHSLEEAKRAQDEGAHYIFFSPIFQTVSKNHVYPKGLEMLRDVTHTLTIPVFALGGITQENYASVLACNAYGFAGISLFQNPNFQLSNFSLGSSDKSPCR